MALFRYLVSACGTGVVVPCCLWCTGGFAWCAGGLGFGAGVDVVVVVGAGVVVGVVVTAAATVTVAHDVCGPVLLLCNRMQLVYVPAVLRAVDVTLTATEAPAFSVPTSQETGPCEHDAPLSVTPATMSPVPGCSYSTTFVAVQLAEVLPTVTVKLAVPPTVTVAESATLLTVNVGTQGGVAGVVAGWVVVPGAVVAPVVVGIVVVPGGVVVAVVVGIVDVVVPMVVVVAVVAVVVDDVVVVAVVDVVVVLVVVPVIVLSLHPEMVRTAWLPSVPL